MSLSLPYDGPDPRVSPFAGAMTGWVVALFDRPQTYYMPIRVLVGRGLSTWVEGELRSDGIGWPDHLRGHAPYPRWYPPYRHGLVEKRVRERAQQMQRELGDDARVEGRVYVLSAEDVALLALSEVE